MKDERFTTLASECGAEHVVQRSRFHGYARATDDRDAVHAFIRDIASRHPDATHCCWAYRTGYPDAPEEHSSDAGEPSGTAGRPIAGAISQAELQNVAVVVARYFGGVKLGIRGLMDAYHETARLTLARGTKVTGQPLISLELELSYSAFDTVKREVASIGGVLEMPVFEAAVRCVARVPRGKAASFADAARALGAKVEEME